MLHEERLDVGLVALLPLATRQGLDALELRAARDRSRPLQLLRIAAGLREDLREDRALRVARAVV
jgi:hypothetical protein